MDKIEKNNDKEGYSYYYYIFPALTFFFQFFSKSKDMTIKYNDEQKKKGDKLFWIFLSTYLFAKGLYYFVINLFTQEENIIKYISSAFLGVFVIGYLCDKFDKKKISLSFPIFLIIGIISKLISLNLCGEIFFGISSSILGCAFESYFLEKCDEEITDEESQDAIVSNTFEKMYLCDFFTTMTVNFLILNLKVKYNQFFLGLFSIIACNILYCLVYFTYQDRKNFPSSICPKKHFIGSVKMIFERRNILFIGLAEGLLSISYYVFSKNWVKLAKEYNPKVNIGTALILILMSYSAAITSFRVLLSYYNQKALLLSKKIGIICVLGFILINFWKDYTSIINGILLYNAGIGVCYPTYSFLKHKHLPYGLRNTIINIFKLPSILFTIYYSKNTKIFGEDFVKKLMLGICCLVFLIQFFFHDEPPKEKKRREKI